MCVWKSVRSNSISILNGRQCNYSLFCFVLLLFLTLKTNKQTKKNQAETHWSMIVFPSRTGTPFRFNRRNSFVLSWIYLLQQCEVGCSHFSFSLALSLFFFFSSPFSSSSSSYSFCRCDCIRRIYYSMNCQFPWKQKQIETCSLVFLFQNQFESAFDLCVSILCRLAKPIFTRAQNKNIWLVDCRRRQLFLIVERNTYQPWIWPIYPIACWNKFWNICRMMKLPNSVL